MKRMRLSSALLLTLAFLTGCSSTHSPEWQMNAKGNLDRFAEAYLSGNDRVAVREFERARAEVARTGRPDLLARIELIRCAARVASLDLSVCIGFEALRADAAAPERAYADYLTGRTQPLDIALLPPAHRAVAAGASTVPDGADPLARLVAAAVLLETGRASPAVVVQAVDVASTQGWRRPLLAWLGVQLKLAEQGGGALEVERIRRRIELVQDKP